MQKLRTNGGNARNGSSIAGNKPGPKETHKAVKNDNGISDDQSGNAGDELNRKGRRFKDWRTSETALPL